MYSATTQHEDVNVLDPQLDSCAMKGLRPEVLELEFAEDAGEKGRIEVDSVDGASPPVWWSDGFRRMTEQDLDALKKWYRRKKERRKGKAE
ncbi:Protein of unknown function [Pyronema omphalodes CBS 100304]|uniref:Uncharacterized protein n=1 Tax=Pyronema omphalodes (strain CBS 100304) TaxID=1076935 RepID=U4L6I1_PYROM|nr:Protein of unknown function [Pyronema omphalodes CBS 100304]